MTLPIASSSVITPAASLFCGGASTEPPDIRTLQRHAARPKSSGRLLPRSLVVIVLINDRPCRALLDSGSLTDFISTTVVDQLKLKFDLLDKPIPLQLAVSGSRSVVKIRSIDPLPIRGAHAQVLELRGSGPDLDVIEAYREELRLYAKSICKEASETPLPPLREINHTIPLIDENQVYSWRQSRCPEALRPLWREKREDYIRTGRWEFYRRTK